MWHANKVKYFHIRHFLRIFIFSCKKLMANTLMILNTWYIASQFNELQLWLKYIYPRREISEDEQHLYEDLLTAFESFPFINNNSREKHQRNDRWLSHSGVAVASHSNYYVFARKSRQVHRFFIRSNKNRFDRIAHTVWVTVILPCKYIRWYYYC